RAGQDGIDARSERPYAQRRCLGTQPATAVARLPGVERLDVETVSLFEERRGVRLAQERTPTRGRRSTCSWSCSSVSESRPKVRISSMIGRRATPLPVSRYSTRGGDSG